jgi:hypothetical protein
MPRARTVSGAASLFLGRSCRSSRPGCPERSPFLALTKGTPAYGGRVLHTLGQIGQTVEAIIAAV